MTVLPEETQALLLGAFSRWRETGRPFVVLRNYERLPKFVPGDVDLLVQDAARAVRDLVDVGGSVGCRLVNVHDSGATSLYFASRDRMHVLRVDVMSRIDWYGAEIVAVEGVLGQRGERGPFFTPRLAHEAYIAAFLKLLYTGSLPERYRPLLIRASIEDGAELAEQIRERFGPELGDRLVADIRDRRWQELEARAPLLRRRILSSHARRPARAVGLLVRDVARWTRRILRPSGMLVAIGGSPRRGNALARRLLGHPALPHSSTWSAALRGAGHWPVSALVRPRLFKNGLVVLTGTGRAAPRGVDAVLEADAVERVTTAIRALQDASAARPQVQRWIASTAVE